MWSALNYRIDTELSPCVPARKATVDRRQVAELKMWARRVWWASHRTRRSKVRALAQFAMTPWCVARNIMQASSEYGEVVASHFGIGRSRQIVNVASAWLRYRIQPLAYYRLQLFRPDRSGEAWRYVESTDTGPMLAWLRAEAPGYPGARAPVFGDKRVFEKWCVESGLPTVPILMEFEEGKLTRTLTADSSLPAADLFSKPANWKGGNGAFVWKYNGSGYTGGDARTRDAATLVRELATMSAAFGRPIIVQRSLRNAAAVASLTSGALGTARIMTVREPRGRAQILLALYRMPTGSSPVDNFSRGCLAAPIDLATGRLGRAVRKDLRLLPVATDRHPDTRARIEGFQLPWWPEAVSLALSAHAAVHWDGIPAVGWDIALLDDGPVLIEGNNLPCSTGTQMITGIPFGNTAFVACLNAHMRELFGSPPARN